MIPYATSRTAMMPNKASDKMSDTLSDKLPDMQTVKLTKREVEVLLLVIEGKSSKEVADQLFVSKRTVDFHLANIYDKLNVTNRVQAFREATRRGLLPDSAFQTAQ